MMKAVGIVGSPRKNGNTEMLTEHTLKAIAEEGLDTELIRLAGLDIRPCTACMVCRDEERCLIDDDLFPLYAKMKEADAIILASPVYFGSATALLKALMERGERMALISKVKTITEIPKSCKGRKLYKKIKIFNNGWYKTKSKISFIVFVFSGLRGHA